MIALIRDIKTKYLGVNNKIKTLPNLFYSTIKRLYNTFKADTSGVSQYSTLTLSEDNNNVDYNVDYEKMSDATQSLFKETASIKGDYCVIDQDFSKLSNKELNSFLKNLVDAIENRNEEQGYEFVH